MEHPELSDLMLSRIPSKIMNKLHFTENGIFTPHVHLFTNEEYSMAFSALYPGHGESLYLHFLSNSVLIFNTIFLTLFSVKAEHIS